MFRVSNGHAYNTYGAYSLSKASVVNDKTDMLQYTQAGLNLEHESTTQISILD